MAKLKYTFEKSKTFTHPITKKPTTLNQIVALRSFTNTNPHTKEVYTVNAGDLGGWIESSHNLSHEGTCWVADNAQMFDNAQRTEHSLGLAYSKACGNSKQSGYSRQMGNSIQSGNSMQLEFSTQMDFSHQTGNSIQTGYSTQKNRSRQEGYSTQSGFSTQSGYSVQSENSDQQGYSTQTGHSKQMGSSLQSDESVQNDFSQQSGFSQQLGSSKQSGHSKQEDNSIQEGDSRQISYSVQKGGFAHSHGIHSTFSSEGCQKNDANFVEVAASGAKSISFNLDLSTSRITLSTGYSYPSNENGLNKFEAFLETLECPKSDKARYLAIFRMLLEYINFI